MDDITGFNVGENPVKCSRLLLKENLLPFYFSKCWTGKKEKSRLTWRLIKSADIEKTLPAELTEGPWTNGWNIWLRREPIGQFYDPSAHRRQEAPLSYRRPKQHKRGPENTQDWPVFVSRYSSPRCTSGRRPAYSILLLPFLICPSFLFGWFRSEHCERKRRENESVNLWDTFSPTIRRLLTQPTSRVRVATERDVETRKTKDRGSGIKRIVILHLFHVKKG